MGAGETRRTPKRQTGQNYAHQHRDFLRRSFDATLALVVFLVLPVDFSVVVVVVELGQSEIICAIKRRQAK